MGEFKQSVSFGDLCVVWESWGELQVFISGAEDAEEPVCKSRQNLKSTHQKASKRAADPSLHSILASFSLTLRVCVCFNLLVAELLDFLRLIFTDVMDGRLQVSALADPEFSGKLFVALDECFPLVSMQFSLSACLPACLSSFVEAF